MTTRLATTIVFLLWLAAPGHAAPISVTYTDSVTGWDWGEVAETTGFSWDQIATVCPQDGVTPCSGSLAGLDFTGWVWATRDQVRDLFVNATDLTAAQMTDYTEIEPSAAWGSQFLSHFASTQVFANGAQAAGLSATTRLPEGVNAAYVPIIRDLDAGATAELRASTTKSTSIVWGGVWIHQPSVTSAPEPASVILLGSALSGLYYHRRRYQRR